MCGIVGLLLKQPALRPRLGELMRGRTTPVSRWVM